MPTDRIRGVKRKRQPKSHVVTLAYIRWFDSAIWREGEHQAEELDGYVEQESAGLLVQETEKDVTIALDHCLDTQYLRLILCIPKANIRAMRKVRI